MIDPKKLTKEVLELYQECDDKLDKIAKVCKKGCSHCCYQYIQIEWKEGLPIEDFIANKMPRNVKIAIKANVKNYIDYFNQNTPSAPLTETNLQQLSYKMALEKIPCPFLLNQKCSIYPVRPFICRTHIVEDSPDFCVKDPLRKSSEEAIKISVEFSPKLFQLGRRSQVRPLIYTVTEVLDIKKTIKPIVSYIKDF